MEKIVSKKLRNGSYENEYGDVAWYKDGKLHREDGPAIEFNGTKKWWFKRGLLHREDGPALEWIDGEKHWFIQGKG